MKILNKTISGAVAITFLLSVNVPVFAETSISSEKEEVIYIMTDANGSTNGVYVVNIFTDNNITDYGKYSSGDILPHLRGGGFLPDRLDSRFPLNTPYSVSDTY